MISFSKEAFLDTSSRSRFFALDNGSEISSSDCAIIIGISRRLDRLCTTGADTRFQNLLDIPTEQFITHRSVCISELPRVSEVNTSISL